MSTYLKDVSEDEWFLYVLFDPLTETAFYIGMTINPRTRLAAHRKDIRAPTSERCREIRENGGLAEMKIIAKTSDYSKIMEWEARMIREFFGRTLNRSRWPLLTRPFYERDLLHKSRKAGGPQIIAVK